LFHIKSVCHRAPSRGAAKRGRRAGTTHRAFAWGR